MKAGTRLHSTVCSTRVVVVKPPADGVTLECGGSRMDEGVGTPGEGGPRAGFDQGTLLNKRYSDELSGTELLCTRGGTGALSANGRLFERKIAKAFPASDQA